MREGEEKELGRKGRQRNRRDRYKCKEEARVEIYGKEGKSRRESG